MKISLTILSLCQCVCNCTALSTVFCSTQLCLEACECCSVPSRDKKFSLDLNKITEWQTLLEILENVFTISKTFLGIFVG